MAAYAKDGKPREIIVAITTTEKQSIPEERLSLATIVRLDLGKAAACFDSALRRVQDDLRDRPEDQTKRSVTLTMELTPGEIEARELDTVAVTFKVKSSVPVKKTSPWTMRVTKTGLLFQPNDADNPRQETLPLSGSHIETQTHEPGDSAR